MGHNLSFTAKLPASQPRSAHFPPATHSSTPTSLPSSSHTPVRAFQRLSCRSRFSEYINPAPHPAESARGNIPPYACLAPSSHEWRSRRLQSGAHFLPGLFCSTPTHPREREIAKPVTLPCLAPSSHLAVPVECTSSVREDANPELARGFFNTNPFSVWNLLASELGSHFQFSFSL